MRPQTRNLELIEKACKLAADRGGQCLSIPNTVSDYVLWKCCIQEHSAWNAQLSQVQGTKNKKGSWCPQCAVNARVTPKTQEDWASSFGGRLLVCAKRTTMQAKWECKHHGEFTRSFSSMIQCGTFCPECSVSLGERKCKAAMEQLFQKPFIKQRFKDLLGLGGRPLEIDIYNDELRLGLEHHGSQHFSAKPYFGVNRFEKQAEHDRRRREFCVQNGITLIEIRQVGEVTPDESLKEIIKEACIKAGIELPPTFEETQLNLEACSIETLEGEMWKRTQDAATAMGWKVISKGYLGVLTKHEFLCDKGHQVSKKPTALFAGEGCVECLGQPILTEDGRTFGSLAEASATLGVTKTSLSSTARKMGRAKGIRVACITHSELIHFREKPELICGFFAALPPCPQVGGPLRKPVVLSDGRVFSSSEEAGRALDLPEGAAYTALKGSGLIGNLRIKQITKQQADDFTNRPELVQRFWEGVPHRRLYQQQRSRAVVLSSGQIFQTITDAAKHLGVDPSSIYSAVQTTGRCKGLYIALVSQTDAAALLQNPAKREDFCLSLCLRSKADRKSG
jgi:hypothetical protein